MPEVERKLAAILSADVVGYSRLIAEDEAGTVERLKTYLDAMGSLVRQHGGRVVDAVGDSLLAEFPSVVDAVACSVAVQEDLAKRNERLPEDRSMRFRIGINLGDVIADDERIYGDGVNIAARIEALAEPGGVSISGTAFDQVEGKLGLDFEDQGEHEVKNIPRPVRLYRVRTSEASEVAARLTVVETRPDDSLLAAAAPEEDESEETTFDEVSTILGTLERAGDWPVADRMLARSVLGELKLDFTGADLPTDGVVEIHCSVLLGQLELIVPEGSEIDMEGLRAIVSAVKHGGVRKGLREFFGRVVEGDKAEPRARPEGEPPLFVVTGWVIFGGIAVVSPRSPTQDGTRGA